MSNSGAHLVLLVAISGLTGVFWKLAQYLVFSHGLPRRLSDLALFEGGLAIGLVYGLVLAFACFTLSFSSSTWFDYDLSWLLRVSPLSVALYVLAGMASMRERPAMESMLMNFYREDSLACFILSNRRRHLLVPKLLLGAVVVHRVFQLGWPPDEMAIVLAILLSLLFIADVLMAYRIRRSYFGGNLQKTREILEFIHEHSRDIGFPRGGSGELLPIINGDEQVVVATAEEQV